MRRNEDQGMTDAVKQDLREALGRDAAAPAAEGRTPEQKRDWRRLGVNSAAIMALAGVVFVSGGVILSFKGMLSFLDMLNAGKSATAVVQRYEEPDDQAFSEVYDVRKALSMDPGERDAYYKNALRVEREEKERMVADRVEDLGIMLRKTLVAGRKVPVAVMAASGGSEQEYRVGDEIAGARVAGIYRGSVDLLLDNRRVTLRVEGTGGPLDGEPRVSLVADSNDVSVNRFKNEDKASIASFIGTTRLESCPPRGFRVGNIGGALSAAGLKDGDILVSINAIPLKTRTDALRAYGSICGLDRVTVEYERDGRIVQAEVRIL